MLTAVAMLILFIINIFRFFPIRVLKDMLKSSDYDKINSPLNISGNFGI